MRDIWRSHARKPAKVVEELPPEELEARRRGARGFAAMAQQVRIDAKLTIGQFVLPLRRSGSGATEADVNRIERGKERASIEWVRYYADGTGTAFTAMFDVWDREAPGKEDRLTVAEARAMIARLLKAGVECPCCGRPCKERRQTLTPNMVRFVRWLVQEYRGEPLEIRQWQREHAEYGGDYAKTSHWGLTKRAPGKAPRWSPTLKGTKFARAQVKIHKAAILWRSEVLRWEGELLDIHQLLHEKPEHGERGDGPHPTLPGVTRT